MNERTNHYECVYTGSCLENLGKRHKVTRTGNRRFLLSIPPPAAELACVRLAVVSHREPSYYNLAVQSWGTRDRILLCN